MATKVSKVRAVDKDKHRVYLAKATEFYDEMVEAVASERWSAAGLLAVHCAISATDAICCFKLGEISNGTHADAAKFLAARYFHKDSSAKAAQLVQILSKKNLVEYESRAFLEKDARQIFKLTERYYNWAISQIA